MKKGKLFNEGADKVVLTRYTTAEEREKIKGVSFKQEEVEKFMEMVQKGLLEAASAHEAAVQDNMTLSAEVSIKLSRPVQNKNDGVDHLKGKSKTTMKIQANKEYYSEEELLKIAKENEAKLEKEGETSGLK